MSECKYCHGDQEVAEIAQKMGFRPDVAFMRIKELESAMQEFIEDTQIHEMKMIPLMYMHRSQKHKDNFKQLLEK